MSMARARGVGSVRERLLAAADELFYGQDVHTVGIERVLERAGVAKSSLYETFGSKDELIRAYLESRAGRDAITPGDRYRCRRLRTSRSNGV